MDLPSYHIHQNSVPLPGMNGEASNFNSSSNRMQPSFSTVTHAIFGGNASNDVPRIGGNDTLQMAEGAKSNEMQPGQGGDSHASARHSAGTPVTPSSAKQPQEAPRSPDNPVKPDVNAPALGRDETLAAKSERQPRDALADASKPDSPVEERAEEELQERLRDQLSEELVAVVGAAALRPGCVYVAARKMREDQVLYLAVDLVTRYAYAELIVFPTPEKERGFLQGLCDAFPYPITKILTSKLAGMPRSFAAALKKLGIEAEATDPEEQLFQAVLRAYAQLEGPLEAAFERGQRDLTRLVSERLRIYNRIARQAELNHKTPWQAVQAWFSLRA